jgi:DNA end-binding protein Ku
MHTLHHADEMQTIGCGRGSQPRAGGVKPQEMKLEQQVNQTFDAPLDLATFRDEYVEGLQKVIESKIAGREVVAPSAPDLPAGNINVMDALRKSLDAVSQGKKKPAKVPVPRTTAKRSRKVG